jgi:polyferredoxin
MTKNAQAANQQSSDGRQRVPQGHPAGRRSGYDLTRIPLLGKWIRRRSWQFQLILPNQILFWIVIVVGFVGIAEFDLSFATTITWFVWFSLVFLLIITTGRGWCAVCPFGGMAEWIQRGRLWHGEHAHRSRLFRGLPVPDWLSRYGYVPTAFMFGLLTWLEEYFEVADGSPPMRTSWTVIGIILIALITFLAFERRAFCRHVCPLGGLIGVLGAGAPVAGFRARDRDVCLRCTTKDCLHGNDQAYGCPWYSWPGGNDSNINCGLCGECYRACPSDNVGLFVDKPFAGLTRTADRRADVAWTVTLISGIMAHQHIHTTQAYADAETWLNGTMGWPHSPNPLLFVALSALCTLVLVAPAWVLRLLLYRKPSGTAVHRDDSFIYRRSPFRIFFLPLAYATIPLLAADYVAVEMLTFMENSPKVVAAVGRHVGMAAHTVTDLQSTHLLDASTVVRIQVAILLIGLLASVGVAWRTVGAQEAPASAVVSATRVAPASAVARLGVSALLAAAGALVIFTYIVTQGEAG